jgi:hypothetical protein
MNPDLQYHYAKQRMNELQKQGAKERLLKPYKLGWKVRSAKALHGLARRLEPEGVLENDTILETA